MKPQISTIRCRLKTNLRGQQECSHTTPRTLPQRSLRERRYQGHQGVPVWCVQKKHWERTFLAHWICHYGCVPGAESLQGPVSLLNTAQSVYGEGGVPAVSSQFQPPRLLDSCGSVDHIHLIFFNSFTCAVFFFQQYSIGYFLKKYKKILKEQT